MHAVFGHRDYWHTMVFSRKNCPDLFFPLYKSSASFLWNHLPSHLPWTTNPLVTGSRLITTSYIYTNTPSMFNVYTSQIYSQLRSQAHERDIGLHIQNNIPSWMKLIERDDHRLMKAACCLVDQRHDGHLILPWTRGRHLMEAFG